MCSVHNLQCRNRLQLQLTVAKREFSRRAPCSLQDWRSSVQGWSGLGRDPMFVLSEDCLSVYVPLSPWEAPGERQREGIQVGLPGP